VQPGAEHLAEQLVGLRVGQHREGGIDARFDRPLTQQIGAERVDGADVRFFEVMHRGIEQAAGGGVGAGFRPRALELFAKTQLQLAGRLLAERDRDDLADRGASLGDQRDDASDQLGGLAGARRGLDDQRLVELAGDQLAILRHSAGARAHGIFLNASRSMNSFGSLRLVRSSSREPHTTWKSHQSQAFGAGFAASVP
jgi:hypothetical protein